MAPPLRGGNDEEMASGVCARVLNDVADLEVRNGFGNELRRVSLAIVFGLLVCLLPFFDVAATRSARSRVHFRCGRRPALAEFPNVRHRRQRETAQTKG